MTKFIRSLALGVTLLAGAQAVHSAAAQTVGNTCAAAASRAQDNIALRLQQQALGAENRESARLHAGLAAQAAANGNDSECWRQLNLSSLFVGLPAGTLTQPTVAARPPTGSPGGSTQGGGVQSGSGGGQ